MNKILLVVLTVVFILSSCKGKDKELKKPNILFVFADDLTYEGVYALGNTEIHTPNLDKLAESGVCFTHAFNMGGWNGAVCVASRAMLNTGRHLWNAKASEKHYPEMKQENQFWSLLMKNAGYDTYMTGKWHVKYPADSLFDVVRHVRPGMPKSVAEAYNRPLSPEDTVWLPWHTKYGGYWEGGKHWTEVVSDNAIEYLNMSKESTKPFFMYLAFNAPHDPRQSPKEYVDMYPLDSVKVPDDFMEMYPWKDSIGCGPGLRDERLAPFPRTEYSVKVHCQEYYALISHLDDQIGRILTHLKETGQDKNTYIIFSADHGLSVGHHGLIGKQNMYDHSMRVPLMIVGPDIPKGERRKHLVYLQDAMATALDLAKVEKPAYVEFNSLLSMIRNPESFGSNTSVYGAYIDLQRMVRNEDYKLIVYPRARKILLFDLKNDPIEMNDLSDKEDYKVKVLEMVNLLKQQMKEKNDPLDLHSFFPDLF